MNKYICTFIVSAFLFFPCQVKADDRIIINGSTTVNNTVFVLHQDKIQQKIGFEFDVFPSSSGRGLSFLAEGRADIAMISSDLSLIIDKLNLSNKFNLQVIDYDLHMIDQSKVLFVVNTDNPIKKLSSQQLKNLLSGKIKDWGELGIENIGAVRVVTEHPTGGVYSMVSAEIMGDDDFAEDVITLQVGSQVALVVAQIPGGIGFLSDAMPIDNHHHISIINTPDLELVQSLSFVTKRGDNRDKIFEIIKSVQEIFKY